jgi:hypothetical protein
LYDFLTFFSSSSISPLIWNAESHEFLNNNQIIANIGPRTNPGTAKKSYGSGKETLRLRANGPARVEEAVSIPHFVGIFFLFFSLYREL